MNTSLATASLACDEGCETEPYLLSLVDSLNSRWLKLPIEALQDVGQPAQTLAGLISLTNERNREVFCSIEKIADAAFLPPHTAKRHLAILQERGWVKHLGRQRGENGYTRRTVTYRVSPKAFKAMSSYLVAPWWSCSSAFTWSERVVLAAVMMRLLKIKSGLNASSFKGGLEGECELIEKIETLGLEDRFAFPIQSASTKHRSGLACLTGLSARSIGDARASLVRRGLVTHDEDVPHHGRGMGATILVPNWDWQVDVSPDGNGNARLSFSAH